MPSIEHAVELYAIVNCTVIGISHILRPRVWVDLFVILRERGEPGVFAIAFLNLIFGSIIVGFHNVWSGIPAVLTVIGWANVIKALIYFAFPTLILRKLQLLSRERPNVVVPGGIIFLLVAALLGYHLWKTA